MIFDRVAKATTKVADGIIGGWVDMYRVVRYSSRGGHDGPTSLVNSHGKTLSIWEGLGCWWVEEHILKEERDIATSLENLFGSSEPSAHADSDSISLGTGGISRFSINANGSCGLGTTTPSTSLTLNTSNSSNLKIESALDKWLGPEGGARLAITSNKSRGKWVWENIIVELDHTPNPIRKTLISLLTGAKWTPYSSKHETKYYGYLRLMPNPAYLTHKNPSTN